MSNWNFRGVLSTYVSFKSLVGSMQLQWHGTLYFLALLVQWEITRGPYCDFSLTRVRWMGRRARGGEYYISKASVVFFYLLFAGRSAKLRCAGRRSGDIFFHSIGRREIIVYLCRIPECMPHRRNCFPPTPSSESECVSPLGSKGT